FSTLSLRFCFLPIIVFFFFFFSSRRRHTRFSRDWSSDVCSSDLAGHGPLGADPAGWFTPPIPDEVVFVEPHPRRIQGVRDGRAVIDTERALLVHRRDRPLSYAFPADVVGDLPQRPEPAAPGYVQVPWDAVEAWVEEGRRLVHYPPNPYHRVDCHPTRRALRVAVEGTVLVDTTETGSASGRERG